MIASRCCNVPFTPFPFRHPATRFGLLTIMGLLATSAWAATGGSISGTVSYSKGLPINGAAVTEAELERNIKHITSTDLAGFYSLTEWSVGKYEVRIDAVGFKPYLETNLSLNACGALLVNADLVVGGRTDTLPGNLAGGDRR